MSKLRTNLRLSQTICILFVFAYIYVEVPKFLILLRGKYLQVLKSTYT